MRRLLPALLLAGCLPSGELGPGFDVESDGPAWIDVELEVDWAPCPLFSGGGGPPAECAEVEVPLDWTDADGPWIELFVKRHGDPDATVQMWMLMGGPGGAGAGYEGYAEQFVAAVPDDVVVYLPDHRGVGRSTRLGCLGEADASPGGYTVLDAEWPTCLGELVDTWGDGLGHFRTTGAAMDLGRLVQATRAPGQDVHIHGGSYGTFWAQRYLQLFPEQPTGVSLLGVVSPTFSFNDYGVGYEDAGVAYLDGCADDPACGWYLGDDPAGLARDVLEDLPGACPGAAAAGLDRAELRAMFGGILIWSWWERAAIPAVVHRLDRCSDDDVTAQEHLAANPYNPLAALGSDRLFSRALGNNIIVGELWDHPGPSIAELEQFEAEALFAPGSGLRTARRIADGWPVYPDDGFDGRFARTDVPILMIEGELDPASPPGQAAAVGEHFDGPDQHYVLVPGAPHSFESPTTEGWSCSLNAMFNFALDPTAGVLDCWDMIRPVDYAGYPDLAERLFGRASLWE